MIIREYYKTEAELHCVPCKNSGAVFRSGIFIMGPINILYNTSSDYRNTGEGQMIINRLTKCGKVV
jgi:hypothetical protein